jgi:hypothetical protein
MPKTLEIIGTYRHEKRRWTNSDDSAMVLAAIQLHPSSKQLAREAGVLDVDGYLTIKGDYSIDEMTKGMTYRFLGVWASYNKFGINEKQFAFRSFVPHIGHDRESIINYLVAAGRGNGIGPSKASRLVDAFGLDEILEVCRTKPDEVAKAVHISQDDAESFAGVLISQQRTENATLEVDRLLTGRGFPRTLARKVIKEFGNKAAEIIANDPYVLLNFQGVGFKKADALYMQLGKDPKSVDRLAICLWYGLNSDNSGHTWHPAKQAVDRLIREIGGDIDFRGAIIRGKEFAEIDPNHYGAIASCRTDPQGFREDDGPCLWLAEARHAAAEQSIIESLEISESETEADRFTQYADTITETQTVQNHARCERCYRPLTAPMVHIAGGKPYGPTCIEKVSGYEFAEVVPLRDWLERNPEIRMHISQSPSGWFETPAYSIWPEASSLENISEHQREQFEAATEGRISVLTGSPGTGKTYLVAQAIRAMTSQGLIGLNDIAIGTPTGKAAVRMSETLQLAGINKRARTWYSHLFTLPADGKFPYKVLFGDETSMDDLPLMAAILRARAPGCHLMLVGDPNQLPPVGNGAPFRDMIGAGVTSGHLTEVRRNAGQIVEACARIRDKQPWLELCNQPGGNLHFHNERSPESQIDQLEFLLAGLSVWDSQVLVPLNDKGPLCRQIVNARLQQFHNFDGQQIGASKFRIGDKVVCLKNSWFDAYSMDDVEDSDSDLQTNDRGQLYIANGELGEIVDSHSKGFCVRLESPARTVIVPVGKASSTDGEESKDAGTGCNWDLGYALSVHKSQGSEFGHVFILVDDYPGARQVCDASWVLTAKSRGKLHTHYIGNPDTVERFCRVYRLDERKTFLREGIIESRISKELAAL